MTMETNRNTSNALPTVLGCDIGTALSVDTDAMREQSQG